MNANRCIQTPANVDHFATDGMSLSAFDGNGPSIRKTLKTFHCHPLRPRLYRKHELRSDLLIL